MAKPAQARQCVADADHEGLAESLRGPGAKQAANQRRHFGRSLFTLAITSGQGSPEKRALCVAALGAAGGDPNAVDDCGQSPIHFAASFDSGPCIRALAALGANLDSAIPGLDGARPIHLAALRLNLNGALALAELGADLLAGDGKGFTALDVLSAKMATKAEPGKPANPETSARAEQLHQALSALTEQAAMRTAIPEPPAPDRRPRGAL